jgi:hypothetical protein
MKHEIIETDEYLLVVDEGEIKGCYYDVYTRKVKHIDSAEYGESIITRNIIAHPPLNGSPILKGVDLLPPLKEDDVEKLAFEYTSVSQSHRRGFMDGYNQAKEKYNLTLEKILDLYIQETGYGMDMWSKEENAVMSVVAKIIQSLSQPKMPIWFEQEMNETFVDAFTYDRVRRFYGKEPKTTTTPEGHTQWVGKYIYQ